jgi:hypothetical protein
MKYLTKNLAFSFLLGALLYGCKKVENVPVPPVEAHFLFKSSGIFEIFEEGDKFKLPVGITAKSTSQINIDISISSPSGAVEGNQYKVIKRQANFSPGSVVDTIIIEGNLSAYNGNRKDTLIISLVEKDNVKSIISNKTFTLIVTKVCLEKNIVLNELLGDYVNTFETYGSDPPYGAYKTKISSVKQLTPTTGEITVENIFDFGWKPIKFILNWTNVNNRTVTLVKQDNIAPASTFFGSSQANNNITVRAHPTGGSGTFSYCKNTLVLKMQVGVTELGAYAPDVYTVNMAR